MLKVLVAPLDWGLGHATRCIPIIKELINQDCTVIIAAGGRQKTLLQEEFPSLRFVEIPGYHIKYGKNRALTVFRLLVSTPKILIRVKQENRWLSRFSRAEQPDLVISDSRYGLYRRGIICVFITHQLAIKSAFGALADRLLQKINYSAIRHFACCWVPDIAGVDSLAGELSHPRKMPSIPTRYIGWLSRFGMSMKENAGAMGTQEKIVIEYDLLVLLSGPEPQRTILENLLLEQVKGCQYRVVVVRGLPGGGKPLNFTSAFPIHDHLSAAALGALIRRSEVVLSRSGYSTVMELVQLRKKAIYIPTPGQTEQEYLGKYLMEKGLAICMEQRAFLLEDALSRTREIPGDWWAASNGLLENEIKVLLNRARASVAGRVGE